jgi:glyoxylase-like metal-dependent hydrolase (beta-lactamase superfamily II)
MNEKLRKIGKRTYCLENVVNIGFYLLNNCDICLIDSGSSKDYAKIIDKILIENNWNLKYIINTHSHADHIGGNNYLQNKYNCEVFSSRLESYFINIPVLEPAFMYGASPIKDVMNHVFYAKESVCKDINGVEIEGLQVISLTGHSIDQIGIVTSDKVCFAGDAYSSTNIVEKYSIQYIYDVGKYIKSLQSLLDSNYDYYIPAHGMIEKKSSAFNTLEKNLETCLNVKDIILSIVGKKITISDLVKKVFEKYNIKINSVQYHVVLATIKAYLKYLEENEKVVFGYEDNEMFVYKNVI